ncbi:MAG: hypothetical protein AB7G28_13995 [Pirellulales bacterium]
MDHLNNEQLRTHFLTMLSVASGMVGVCATAIGLIGIVKRMSNFEVIVDDLFALGALFFLFVTGLSFVCLRTRLGKKAHLLVLVVDMAFFSGLATVVIASLMLTWMVI